LEGIAELDIGDDLGCDSETEAALDAVYAAEAKAGIGPMWRAPRPRPSWRCGEVPPRYFTPRECCRLQGFPENFQITSSGRRCRDPGRFYHFIGNAVAPPVIRAIGESLIVVLQKAGVITAADVAPASVE